MLLILYTNSRIGQTNVYGGGVVERCIICEKTQKQGIHLYTSFICTDCERAMIATSTSDPAYKYYINQLKVIKETKILS
ncbi:sigma factor G inhibitor Gin [Lederbergia graminis]|uniref:Sigma factor G inhibitor Gin n=1 Tax=Lederbergia graminis TaxID=735518 RepID=A0ABW0LG96_9BACI|nr:sigma factor G inhibitor Gin [Bacillaceae bacterium]